jgi:hypothetical protein
VARVALRGEILWTAGLHLPKTSQRLSANFSVSTLAASSEGDPRGLVPTLCVGTSVAASLLFCGYVVGFNWVTVPWNSRFAGARDQAPVPVVGPLDLEHGPRVYLVAPEPAIDGVRRSAACGPSMMHLYFGVVLHASAAHRSLT